MKPSDPRASAQGHLLSVMQDETSAETEHTSSNNIVDPTSQTENQRHMVAAPGVPLPPFAHNIPASSSSDVTNANNMNECSESVIVSHSNNFSANGSSINCNHRTTTSINVASPHRNMGHYGPTSKEKMDLIPTHGCDESCDIHIDIEKNGIGVRLSNIPNNNVMLRYDPRTGGPGRCQSTGGSMVCDPRGAMGSFQDGRKTIDPVTCPTKVLNHQTGDPRCPPPLDHVKNGYNSSLSGLGNSIPLHPHFIIGGTSNQFCGRSVPPPPPIRLFQGVQQQDSPHPVGKTGVQQIILPPPPPSSNRKRLHSPQSQQLRPPPPPPPMNPCKQNNQSKQQQNLFSHISGMVGSSALISPASHLHLCPPLRHPLPGVTGGHTIPPPPPSQHVHRPPHFSSSATLCSSILHRGHQQQSQQPSILHSGDTTTSLPLHLQHQSSLTQQSDIISHTHKKYRNPSFSPIGIGLSNRKFTQIPSTGLEPVINHLHSINNISIVPPHFNMPVSETNRSDSSAFPSSLVNVKDLQRPYSSSFVYPPSTSVQPLNKTNIMLSSPGYNSIQIPGTKSKTCTNLNIQQTHQQTFTQLYGQQKQQQPPNQQQKTRLYQSQQQKPSHQSQKYRSITSTLAKTSTISDPATTSAYWTTHKAPSGANYYYNSVTKVSTYTRPSCLASDSNNALVTSAQQSLSPSTLAAISERQLKDILKSNKPAPSIKQLKTCKWTEYIDQATDKKYYYDGITTTWDKPADYHPPIQDDPSFHHNRNKINPILFSDELKQIDCDSGDTIVSFAPKKRKKKDKRKNPDGTIQYGSKAEAVAAFKGLLLAKDVLPAAKWNDVLKICSNDPRWEACPTTGEKKQALAEYQTRRANELREEKRRERVRAKDAFTSLLAEVLPSVRNFDSSANIRFNEVRDALSRDDRFYAVDKESTREELFYDFVEELRKRDERRKRGRKRDAKDAFIAVLKYREETGQLTFASTWTSFLSCLNDEDRTDSKFAVSSAMSDSDRQLYFADYVIELQAAEDEKRRRIRDARKRAEKAQRDAYRDSLRRMALDSKILPSTRWRNVEDILSVEETFGPIQAQDRDAPREMFEDFVEDWADAYRRDRSFLTRLLSSSSAKKISVTVNTEFESFIKALLEASAYSPEVYSDTRRVINREDPVSGAKLYFDELQVRAKEVASSKSNISCPLRIYGRRRRKSVTGDDSSEDEGEIHEDCDLNVDIKIKKGDNGTVV